MSALGELFSDLGQRGRLTPADALEAAGSASGLARGDVLTVPGASDTSGADEDEAMPRTKEELGALVESVYGIRLPDVAVCEGHSSPLDILWTLFSRRYRSVVVVGGRGTGKTLIVGLWLALTARFYAGGSMIAIGAIEQQARRAYDHVRRLLGRETGTAPDKNPAVVESLRKLTTWTNGSTLEVVAATPRAVNGPHCSSVAFDEIDLAPLDVWTESRGILQSEPGVADAVEVALSTRKSPTGLLQSLLDETAESIKSGDTPARHVMTACVWEVVEERPDCGVSCGCDKIKKPDGRNFADVCGGRAKRARGWLPLSDLTTRWQTSSESFWLSQCECRKPDLSNAVLPAWSRSRYGLRGWRPLPEIGPVHVGFDPGGSNPHGLLFLQLVEEEMDFESDGGLVRHVPAGSVVAFDLVYRAEVAVSAFAESCWTREQSWREHVEGFRVAGRHYDAQGKAAMLEMQRARPWVPVFKNFASKDVLRDVDMLRALSEDGRLFVDLGRASILADEIEAWHLPDGRSGTNRPEIPVDEFDHAISALRYALASARVLARRRAKVFGRDTGNGARSSWTVRPAAGDSPYQSGVDRYAPRPAAPTVRTAYDQDPRFEEMVS